MTTEKYLPYRGDIKAVLGVGGALVFTTVHREGQSTAVFRLDGDKLTLAVDPLPAGGLALVSDGATLWTAGSDRVVYASPVKGGKPKPLTLTLAEPPVGLVLLSGERLGILVGSTVQIVARKDGAPLQTLELPEPGTCLAADPTGQWLAVGGDKGTVAVFEIEDKPSFVPSASGQLHDGAVSALWFEPEELRFLSAGKDQKLLSTLARGKLEPEDRGRGNNHSDTVTAVLGAPGDRFLTGSRDASVKTWSRGSNVKPATLKDGVGAVVGLALVTVHERTLLIAASEDNTLRFFQLDEAGKFGDSTVRMYDAYAGAKSELSQSEGPLREKALWTLASYNDTASIELIAGQVRSDADHGLRLLATKLLAEAKHPRAVPLLEPCLGHNDEAVRMAALAGLRKHLGAHDLRPLDLALRADKLDVGQAAITALEELAPKDDQALARLKDALDAKVAEVRQAALASLEKVFPATSPEADLAALTSKFADLRRWALLRLFQRKLLQADAAPSALRRRTEDADSEVRRVAFLFSLFTRPKALTELRARDAELQRQLTELEGGAPAKETKEPKKTAKEAPARTPAVLDEDDLAPLLQATASRSLDTCLRGGRGLAVLGDPRAFGLLLQLSREDNNAARVEVCRALAALDDSRALKRLRSMLYDGEAGVRDAAFSALAAIHQDDPLLPAEAGLSAAFEDVRRRGLQVLIERCRKKLPKTTDEPAWQLLVRALNDSFAAVRSEAFKACLNLKMAGGGVATHRFVLQSIHADVRLEVLTEMTAQADQDWAWNLLLEFFNDADPYLRKEAFAFAVKKTKELTPLETALAAHYADVRKLAVEGLVKKHTKASQTLLVRALVDPEKEVRQLALKALVDEDARAALTAALTSIHPDVRLGAAQALAVHGDPAALAPLLALATAPEPPQKERVEDWRTLAAEALVGLGRLANPSALPQIVPLLQSKHETIRGQAAFALIWVSRPDSPEALRQALHHEDPAVRRLAAFGLAYLGDPLAASLVFTPEAAAQSPSHMRLAAALALGPAAEDQLTVFLDDPDDAARQQALVLMMLLEMAGGQSAPSRCLACLASKMPRVRLTAARGLEAFADADTFAKFAVQLVNDRGDDQDWKIQPGVVEALAELLTNAPSQLRAETALLLRNLKEKEQAGWDQVWTVTASRFAGEIAELRQAAAKRPPAPRPPLKTLQQLAFGAYVGLVREQSGDKAAVVRVRQTALTRLLELATGDDHFKRAAVPVLVQSLGDPNEAVRVQAFDQLQKLGMDRTILGGEALETGHTDLGVKGLELLSGGAGSTEGQAILERVMLTRDDKLSIEAAKLLLPPRGVVAVSAAALTALHDELRQQAVAWLTAEYDRTPAAREALRKALGSRYRKVRQAAAYELADKKDAAAFPALVEMLTLAEEAKRQKRVIEALVALGDPRAVDALLDRLQNDPAGTAAGDDLLKAVGSFRRPESVGRLLGLMVKGGKWLAAAFQAAVTVSGYDQAIDDPDEEHPAPAVPKKEHPRHDGVLAKLLERLTALGDVRKLGEMTPWARWARGKEVQPALAALATYPDDDLRHAAIEALGWRLRKRGGDGEVLVKSLKHRDPQTQFLAAEGLARGGRADGVGILLSSIEFQPDFDLRRRAVAALGELGDARALEQLLKLATEDGHALQDEAAEALGHLGKSEKGPDIARLLERFVRAGVGSVGERALRGLRWLDTREGWQLIRQQAGAVSPWRQTALELLGYNDDPATRDLFLRLLTTEANWWFLQATMTGARRLWGESLDPDYAVIQNANARRADFADDVLKRVCEQGDARRLFDVLPKCPPDTQQAISVSLLNRATPPLAEAEAALDSPSERTAQLAVRLIGRAASKKSGPALTAGLKKWLDAWDDARRKLAHTHIRDDRLTEALTPCVASFLWAAGRLGVAAEAVLAAAAARSDDRLYQPVRQAAVAALAALPVSNAVLTALEGAAVGHDAAVRAQAVDALARLAPDRATKLAERALNDRTSFNRLAGKPGVDLAATLRTAASQVHYQGVALPYLAARGDVDALALAAQDPKLPEAVRLGAVEALARMAREPAELVLITVGQSAKEEELRKAAWRGLRR